MEKKKYLCKWGDWDDHALNAYDERTEEVTEGYFSKKSGYDEEDINAIDMLRVGEEHDVSSGNQIVVRIK